MQSITFSFYPSGRSPQDLGSFSAAPFSSSPGDFRYASLIRPQPINRLPVFFGNRFLADIPVTFAYSHPLFGKSKAVLSVSGGPLKGRVVKIDASKNDEQNKSRCLHILMKDHIEPWIQRSHPELIRSNEPKRDTSSCSQRRGPELHPGSDEPEQEQKASIGEVASHVSCQTELAQNILEGTQALLQQGKLGTSEALSRGGKTLGRVATAASALATLGDHAPNGISRMSFRQGIEAIVDFSAQQAASSGASVGLIAMASLAMGGPTGPLLTFALGAAGSFAGSELHSRFLQESVDDFSQDLSKFVIMLPEESLRESQRDQALMRTLVASLCDRIRGFFHGSQPQSCIPIEFHVSSTGREPMVREVQNRILPLKRSGQQRI